MPRTSRFDTPHLQLFRVLQAAIGHRNTLKPGSHLHEQLSRDIEAVHTLMMELDLPRTIPLTAVRMPVKLTEPEPRP
jgi:hypothetical protein